MDRRSAVKSALVTTALASQLKGPSASAAEELAVDDLALKQLTSPVFIATWSFAKAACEKSRSTLQAGGSLLDAVERGINVTELDTSINSVGYGGLPNAAGVVQLDASFMDGQRQRAGAVAALEGFANPISVARRVMETTRHVMLVGDDAARFAQQNGFAEQDMLTDEARRAWQRWQAEQQGGQSRIPADSHDTIALLGCDSQGHLVGGCSTSGLAYKLPGRVGDSPLIGAGLYVDGSVGAAGATGIGENVLRYCGSFLIVENMRQGMPPSEACAAAIRRIAAGEQRPYSELSVNFVALTRDGQVGAAGTDAGFRCCVVDAQQSLLVRPLLVNS